MEEVAGIKEAFDSMDTSKIGRINLEQLRDGLAKLGQHVPDTDLQVLLEAVSTGHRTQFFYDGLLFGYSLFATWVHAILLEMRHHINNNEYLTWSWFLQADVDGDGTLNYGEFVAVSVHLKKMANDEHLHRAFSFFDKNKSGFIEIDELRDALNDDADSSSEEVASAIMHDVDTDKVSCTILINMFVL